jgi:cytosine/adenosine deaminase-related metal-dependent hydrolase
VSDRNGRQGAQAGMRENIRFLESRRPGDPVQGAFGLHAAFSLSDRTLRAAAEANQSLGAGFHVHVAEDRIDRGAVRRLEASGILSEKTLAAHCIHITAADRQRLARRGVSVVHNPQSNNNNAVGVCDVDALESGGVLVGLGSDGYSPRLWDEYKTAMQMEKQRAGDPRVNSPGLLWNNRAIVKKTWGVEIGRIETGARADLLVVDYYPPTPIDAENLFGHLLFGIANAPVDSLMVEGRFVLRGKQFVNLDERRIAEQAAVRAKALWERL